MSCLMRPHLICIYNHKVNQLVITYNQAKSLICLTISLIPSCHCLHNETNFNHQHKFQPIGVSVSESVL